jgi:hypothetical protein
MDTNRIYNLNNELQQAQHRRDCCKVGVDAGCLPIVSIRPDAACGPNWEIEDDATLRFVLLSEYSRLCQRCESIEQQLRDAVAGKEGSDGTA